MRQTFITAVFLCLFLTKKSNAQTVTALINGQRYDLIATQMYNYSVPGYPSPISGADLARIYPYQQPATLPAPVQPQPASNSYVAQNNDNTLALQQAQIENLKAQTSTIKTQNVLNIVTTGANVVYGGFQTYNNTRTVTAYTNMMNNQFGNWGNNGNGNWGHNGNNGNGFQWYNNNDGLGPFYVGADGFRKYSSQTGQYPPAGAIVNTNYSGQTPTNNGGMNYGNGNGYQYTNNPGYGNGGMNNGTNYQNYGNGVVNQNGWITTAPMQNCGYGNNGYNPYNGGYNSNSVPGAEWGVRTF
jgi:hypothetical protein